MSGSGEEDLDEVLAGLAGAEGEGKSQRGLTSLLDDLDEAPAEPGAASEDAIDPSLYEPITEEPSGPATVAARAASPRPPSPAASVPETIPPEREDDEEPPAAFAEPAPAFAEPSPPRPASPRPRPASPPPPAASPAPGFDDPEAAAAAVDVATADPLAQLAVERRKPRTLLWVAIISFAAAGLGAVLYTQSDSFHPERSETREAIAESEKERALAQHRAEQPVAGTVSIDASQPEAAVWVLLGRTPLESFEVSSGQVHEVRFELEGYQGVDAVVARPDWSDGADGLRAQKVVRLQPGDAKLPPYPPESAVRPAPGPEGRGRLVLDSEPAGARVWLLIGFTPDVELRGISAGRSYLFEVRAEGALPAFVEVSSEDWVMQGEKVSKMVTLRPVKKRK